MRIFLVFLGWALLLIGLPLLPTPIPVGAVMIAAGLALLITNSRMVRHWLKNQRAKNRALDSHIRKAEAKSPAAIRRTLEKTAPPPAE